MPEALFTLSQLALFSFNGGFGFFAGFYLLWKLTRQHGASSQKGEKTLAPGQESKDSDTATTDEPKTPPRP